MPFDVIVIDNFVWEIIFQFCYVSVVNLKFFHSKGPSQFCPGVKISAGFQQRI